MLGHMSQKQERCAETRTLLVEHVLVEHVLVEHMFSSFSKFECNMFFSYTVHSGSKCLQPAITYAVTISVCSSLIHRETM